MTFLLFESERSISHVKILVIISQLSAASEWQRLGVGELVDSPISICGYFNLTLCNILSLINWCVCTPIMVQSHDIY